MTACNQRTEKSSHCANLGEMATCATTPIQSMQITATTPANTNQNASHARGLDITADDFKYNLFFDIFLSTLPTLYRFTYPETFTKPGYIQSHGHRLMCVCVYTILQMCMGHFALARWMPPRKQAGNAHVCLPGLSW